MKIDELSKPIASVASYAQHEVNSDSNTKLSKTIIDGESVVVSEILNSSYETSMNIIKNLAPSEEELELREQRKKEVLKKEQDRKILDAERLEKEIVEEELSDELTSKTEQLI